MGRMNRIPFLDAIRGILASVVVAHHILMWEGINVLNGAAAVAVCGFFILSGYVLARGYDGNVLAFFVRRFIRLWPVYAVCVTTGYLLYGDSPTWQELIWWPTARLRLLAKIDLPAWTLYIEAWATPLLPVLVWIARWNRMAALATAMLLFMLSLFLMDGIYVSVVYFAFFAVGIACSRFEISFPDPAPPLALWLGRIGYSLFLSHWVVLTGIFMVLGRWAILPAVPAIFLVAFGVWWAIERPSIRFSRRVGAWCGGPPIAPNTIPIPKAEAGAKPEEIGGVLEAMD
jgi:peptidoglycan/LPS O-acetylase OafA/YrhL